jgi:hypothetical protein
MRVDKLMTVDELRQAVSYDPETGVFIWTKKRCGRCRIGSKAGAQRLDGYIEIYIHGKTYKAHRLAWLYMNGEWPSHQIDHIDGDRANNRIKNLRDLTKVLNMQNQRRPQKSNTSGYLGVSWQRAKCKWEARISVGGVRHFLGTHPTAEDAYVAYLDAKRQLHGSCTI